MGCLVGLMCGSIGAQQSDGFHLKVAEPAQTVVTSPTSSVSQGLTDEKIDQIEEVVSSKISEVVDEVLDLIAGIDWSDWLDRILPEKFKEILASAGLWPIEGSPIDIDMNEVSDMGKEVMENISTLGD